MALSARELVLILRATNQASGPLRQVARDLRSLGSSGTVAGRAMDQVATARRWQKFGLASAVLRDTGRSARIMGIATAAGLGYAANSAATFATQVGYIATQTGRTDASVGQLQRNAQRLGPVILKTMRDSTSSTEDLTQAGYDLFSSVDSLRKPYLTLSDGAKLLKLNSDAAIAGQTDIATSTDASISVMNAFGQTVEQMTPNMQKMFSAVRFGRMTFAELAQTMSTTAPAAKAAGQSFETLLGTMAFLTRRLDVKKAAIGFARLTEILGREKMVSGLKEVGVNVATASGQMKQLPDIIQAITNRFPQLKKGGVELVQFFKKMSGTEGTIQARRAFVFLAQQMDQYREMLNRTNRNQGEFTRALRVMEATTGVKWAKFTNQLRAFALEMGTTVMPVLLELVQPLIDLFHWFEKLDQETRTQVARWLAIGAAIAILGGTLASVIGNIGTIVAAIKAGGGSLTMILGTIGLVSAALLILAGHGDLVKRAFQNLFDTATSSARNFAIAIGLVLLAVRRLMAAFAASALLGGVAGRAGMLSGMLFGPRGPRATTIAMSQQTRAIQEQARAARGMQATLLPSGRQVIFSPGAAANAEKVSKASRVMAASSRVAGRGFLLAGAGIAALGAPLLIAVGATAAIAGGAYLLNRRMEAAAKQAERLKAAQAEFRFKIEAPTRAAEGLGSFGMDIRDTRRAELAVEAIKLRIKELRVQLKGASADQRPGIMNQINNAILDRAEATEAMYAANNRAITSWRQMNTWIQGTGNNLITLVTKQNQLRQAQQGLSKAQDELNRARESGGLVAPLGYVDAVEKAQKRVSALKAEIGGLQRVTSESALVLRRSFTKAVVDLGRAGLVPKVGQKQIDDILQTFLRLRQRMPTMKELRMAIQVALDPTSKTKLDADIAALIRSIQSKRQIAIQAKKGKQFAIDTEQIQVPKKPPKLAAPWKLPTALQAPTNAKQVKGNIDAVFKIASKQKVTVTPPPQAVLNAVGANISAGIQAGLKPVQQRVIKTIVENTVKGFEQAGDGGSPMMLFARKVGIPIVQGVIVGILSMAGEAADAAVFVIDAIEGKTIAKMTSFMEKQRKTLNQMNNNLQRLVNRRVPLQLVEQLAQLGKEGAAQIAKLASSSDAELRKFVVAWKRTNNEVNRSARFNWTRLTEFVDAGAEKLLDIYNTARDQLRDFVLGSLNDFTELSRRGADAIANAFGQLFQGPMGIANMIGPAFDDAMASYSSSMADLEGQMLELQQRQADTIGEFMERRRDELRQAFGQLFSGPILSGGFAAGSVRDLIADLNRQVEAFRNWRSNLDQLTNRGLPTALLKELEELGPDAARNLALLANATDEELAAWVAAWKAGQQNIETVAQNTFMNMEGFAEAMSEIAEQMSEVAARMRELKPPERATFATLLADLQAQTTGWADFNTMLTSLRDKGVPGALLTQLAELGVEGVEIIRILNAASGPELASYVSLWISAQDQIKKAKNEWMKAMSPEEILTGLNDQVTALNNWEAALQSLAARGVSSAIIKQLREMGPEALPLLQGLVSMTDEQLFGEKGFVNLWKKAHTDIDTSARAFVDTQVALWREQGSKIALGLIAGVLDEQEKLLSFFRNLFKSLLQEAQKETKTKSPSMVYFDLGRNIVRGFQAGLSSVTPTLATPSVPSVAGAFGHRTSAGIQMTVNAHHSESLQSTLERTSFRMRQRRVN